MTQITITAERGSGKVVDGCLNMTPVLISRAIKLTPLDKVEKIKAVMGARTGDILTVLAYQENSASYCKMRPPQARYMAL